MDRSEVELMKYGSNKRSTRDAREAMEEKHRQAKSYEKEAEDAKHIIGDELAVDVDTGYKSLTETIQKKLRCLETMIEISGLEDSCGSLSAEFDAKAVQLVDSDERRKVVGQETGDQNPGFISPSAQDCIFATRDNWDWIIKMVDCIKVHLLNSSEYHQFFHECDESSDWLEQDLARIAQSFDGNKFRGDYEDAQRLLQELEDMARIMRQWDAKTHQMWERANKVVPVNYRTEGIPKDMPCRAIANYETKQINIRDGEDLLLLNNSKSNMWLVRNARGQEAEVPALCILIPGPTSDGLEAATRLRLKLLACWTNILKRMGKRLLCFMLLVFKPVYDEDEIGLLRKTQNIEKADLMRILDFIEDSMRTHWSDHEAFIELQERMLALRMILEEAGDNPMEDESTYRALVVQVTMLEKLMRKYKDLWEDWERHKVALETSRAPELMLMVDKWDQLQFVPRSYMAKFWRNELDFNDLEKSMTSMTSMVAEGVSGMNDVRDSVAKETIETSNYQMASRLMSQGSYDMGDGSYGYGDGSFGQGTMVAKTSTTTLGSAPAEAEVFDEGSAGYGESTKTTTTSATSTSKGGGRGSRGSSNTSQGLRMASVGSVSSTGEGSFGYGEFDEIEETDSNANTFGRQSSMVEPTEFGMAHETRTAETEQLMSAESDEQKTFVIRSVVDPRTDKEISFNDAIMAGIISAAEGVYVNPVTYERYPIPVAMTAGLIKVSFTTTRRSREKKSTIGIITVKTTIEPVQPYRIISALNMKTGKWMDQQPAAKEGIVDSQRGVFKNASTGKEMLLSDAIDAGHVQVEYTEERKEPESVTKMYAVRAVVDVAAKRTVTFQEAIRRGILIKESCEFRDTITGDTMYVGDAIMRGFLKARQIDNAQSLNIDPENRLVIDKTDIIWKKLLHPLGVISAFRKAAREEGYVP